MFKLWTEAEVNVCGKSLSEEAVTELTALRYFFERMYPVTFGAMPNVYTYQGLADTVEVRFIRFEWNDKSYTFVVQHSLYDYFISNMFNTLLGDEWWDKPNQCPEMVAKGWKRTVTKMPIEFSMEVLSPLNAEPYPWEDLCDGDLFQLEDVMEEFALEFRQKLAYTTCLADKVGYLIKDHDHDLYLSFKGVDFFRKINVGLDRVYPKLPECGEVTLGDAPINADDWVMYSKVVQVNVKRVGHATNQINRMIKRYEELLPNHPYIQGIWQAKLKEQMLAASHFLKRIYGYTAEHGVKIMEEVANDVIGRLTVHGGNIGLDLNEWVVYEYPEDGTRPTPVTDETLDFKVHLYDRYTVSFVDALYGYLLNTPNPYIKPYDYREVVTGDDGIPLGSIRQV